MVFVRRLETPSDEEIGQCALLMRNAFRSVTYDTFGDSLVGGDKSLDILLHQAALGAAVAEGELWVAGPAEQEIGAVAIWFPPQTDYLITEKQRAAGWYELEAKFSPELKSWYSEYFVPRMAAWSTECLGKDTQLNSWRLFILATSPNHQKKGLAGALIEAVEAKAKAEGTPMCLETSNAPNVAFYINRGFRVRGTINLTGAGGDHVLTCFSKP
ncbi:N-acetyltransferase domain-containing protein [Mycena indigotica]|uniref:N-acetyltransferase domain-containing protein n=1 Tax=Mycena indigotica TaxID=2126181 RepID=A0A8H6W8B0_9AGAR|nr:N-acetyltransferase domain-containing protein [Mycena indigotica]KAF7309494.1 N-acetyltransferase domain-containing protein [Mycena indigotica]